MSDTAIPNRLDGHWIVYLAGGLVVVSGLVHLVIGVRELVGGGQATLGVLYLVATVLAFGLVGAYLTRRIRPRPAYAFGAGLMFLYLLAYADWHVFGYAEASLPLDAVGLEHDHSGHDSHDHNGHDSHDHNGHDDGDDHGHDHNGHDDGDSAIASFLSHVRDDAFALVSKTAELVAGVLLAALAVVHRA